MISRQLGRHLHQRALRAEHRVRQLEEELNRAKERQQAAEAKLKRWVREELSAWG